MTILKFFSVAMLATIFSAGLSSCNSSDDDAEGGSTLSQAAYESISGKYDVTNGSAYQSIELGAGGTYIITKASASAGSKSLTNAHSQFLSIVHGKKTITRSTSSSEPIVLYGSYTKTGDNTLLLEGFGTLTIVYNGTTISGFQLTPTGGSTLSLTVHQKAVYESNAVTNLLCRTWNFISIHETGYENGQKSYDYTINAGDTTYVDEDGEVEKLEDSPKQVLFSKSGTYMIYYLNQTLAVKEWKWKSLSDQTLYYREVGDAWDEEDYGTVQFTGKKSIITEEYEETYNGITYKDITVTTLSAAN